VYLITATLETGVRVYIVVACMRGNIEDQLGFANLKASLSDKLRLGIFVKAYRLSFFARWTLDRKSLPEALVGYCHKGRCARDEREFCGSAGLYEEGG
jgi:hypothetical protein